jgi:hypothetical protein
MRHAALEAAGADLHALRIEHHRDVRVELARGLAHHLEPLAVLDVGIVREVEPRHVHAGVDHRLDRVEAIAGRADRRDQLGLSDLAPTHGEPSPHSPPLCNPARGRWPTAHAHGSPMGPIL